MNDELKLDAETIEAHYDSLLSGAESCQNPISVENDDETNISVRHNISVAYGGAILAQNDISSCLCSDASHLKQLGETFISVDDNLSTDIDNLLNYQES